MSLRTSILLPSFRRSEALMKCLEALNRQTHLPDEMLVVWQGDDLATRDAATAFASHAKFELRILHLDAAGIVSSENAALAASTGEIILMLDDDVIAPPDWIARHLAHYDDPTIGGVGGPAVNHRADGSAFPVRTREPIGRLSFVGRAIGNMYDHPPAWRSRPPIDVDHLVGYNMSLRRSAFDRFEDRLRPYWQMFEMDACLQVKSRGFRVRFDFANAVDHYPTNTVYLPGREGDLDVKIYNAAYNHAFIFAKHRRSHVQRALGQAYLYGVGTSHVPGLIGSIVAMMRFGHPIREMKILIETLKARREGTRDGRKARS